MDFTNTPDTGRSFELIPSDTLAFAILHVREQKRSKTLNKDGNFGSYLDCELTIDEGQPHAKRKLWTNIVDPEDPMNTQGGREMGATAFKRILEARGNGYNIDTYFELQASRVAIRIGIEIGEGSFTDKNVVVEFLTPNPKSEGNRGWKKLLQGGHQPETQNTQPPSRTGGFDQPAQPSQPAPAGGVTADTPPTWMDSNQSEPPPAEPVGEPVGDPGDPQSLDSMQFT